MTANTGNSNAAWIASVAIAATLAASGAASAAPVDDVDDSASVELLDDAIDALERGDGETYELLTDRAEQGVVWLPAAGVDAFFDRDSQNLTTLSEVLGSSNADQFDWAAAAVDNELVALRAIPDDGSSSTVQQADDIADADEIGVAMLEILDHRGLVVPDISRSVLGPLDMDGGATPTDAMYEQAIIELDRLHESASAPGPTPATPAAPAIDPAPISEPPSAPVATSAPLLTAAPAASADNSTMLMLAAMGLAVIAIIVGLVTAMRGRKHGQLADIAYTDGLTGLKNRRRLDADIADQQTRNRPTATLMVDVDHFKKFNDEHGHAMGDDVLRLVGDTLSQQFRRTDVPYRYGGEEFCVLLPDTTEADAMAAGERLRTAIADIDLPIQDRITASIGVSIGPASTITETIERADGALYIAKENGRNQVALAYPA